MAFLRLKCLHQRHRKYKRSKKELIKNSSSKIKYVRNDLIEMIIKHCRGIKQCNEGINRMEKEKQRKHFRAVLGLKEYDIMITEEYSVT